MVIQQEVLWQVATLPFTRIVLFHPTCPIELFFIKEHTMITRRDFLKLGGAGILTLYAASRAKFLPRAFAQVPGRTLDPLSVSKYKTPLLIPPVMPKAGTIKLKGGKNADYYEISMRQITQQILPAGMPAMRDAFRK